MKPDVLLMDDPYAALDTLAPRKIQGELQHRRGDTQICDRFVTHSMAKAAKTSNRVLIFSRHLEKLWPR